MIASKNIIILFMGVCESKQKLNKAYKENRGRESIVLGKNDKGNLANTNAEKRNLNKINNKDINKDNTKIINEVAFGESTGEVVKDIKNAKFIEINPCLTKISRSICKIKIHNKEGWGTGFLLKFLIGNQKFLCLMTNEHVIRQEFIESKKTIEITFDFEEQKKNIILNKKQRIIKDFTYLKGLDITLVELLDIDNINEDLFLEPNLDNNINYNDLKGKKIFIPQYPKGKKFSYSEGEIIGVKGNNYEIMHKANTLPGSSGSPIFLINTTKVIGIHAGAKTENEITNFGYFIYPVINLLKDKNVFNKIKCEKFEGFHKYIYDDGSYYEGEWKNGLRNGKGKQYDKDGNLLYDGDWVNDKQEGIGKVIYPDGSYFIGQIKNNKRHGKGKAYKEDGKLSYEGDFINDKAEGIGKYMFEDDYYYIGEIKNGPNGKGLFYDKDGNIIYEGDFVNGKFEGKGRFNYNLGFYYIGEWKNGKRHGRGNFYDKNGNLKIDGEWFDDKAEGEGKMIFENGDYYIGEIKNFKKNGRGKIFDKNGKVKYDCQWVNDLPEGHGSITKEDETFVGELKNGAPNGKGKIYRKEKVIYIGYFVDGQYEGMGRMEYEDGSYYEGEWKKGLRNGKGKLYDKNGNIVYEGDFINNKFEGEGQLIIEDQYYIGEFQKGLMHGKGCLFWQNGDPLYEGDWVNGKMEGHGKLYIHNGDIYIGDFKNGEMSGQGTLYDPNGRARFNGRINVDEYKNLFKFMFDIK